MLYTISDFFVCWTSHILSQKTQKSSFEPYMSYCHISILPMLWYILLYLSSMSVFVYMMTFCIKRELQSMVTALEYL